MVTTNLITFEVHFTNSTETIIFNTSIDSMNRLVAYLKEQNYIFSKAKEYFKKDSRFKVVSKQRFINCIDCNTELINLLKLS